MHDFFWNYFIAYLRFNISLLRKVITKINQLDCSIAVQRFSKYRTEHMSQSSNNRENQTKISLIQINLI